MKPTTPQTSAANRPPSKSHLFLAIALAATMALTGCAASRIASDSSLQPSLAVSSLVPVDVNLDGLKVGEANKVIPSVTEGEHRLTLTSTSGDELLAEQLYIAPADVTEVWLPSADLEDTVAAPDVSSDPTERSVSAPAAAWETKADAVLATARGLIGTAHYAHRYAPPSWFDCSGFTYYVFLQNGVKLGTKDDDKQVKLGTKVLLANLRKGDLVFFYSTVSGPGNIGHVGIYAGGDKFIHIFSPGATVAISSLKGSSWWRSHYITARRVIQ